MSLRPAYVEDPNMELPLQAGHPSATQVSNEAGSSRLSSILICLDNQPMCDQLWCACRVCHDMKQRPQRKAGGSKPDLQLPVLECRSVAVACWQHGFVCHMRKRQYVQADVI